MELVGPAYKLATKVLNGRLIAPYQREGVTWMLWRELQKESPIKGGFLCDEMGLGKTVQIISTILGNPDKKTLIVVPKSIVSQWKEEIEKFAPNLKSFIHDGPSRTNDVKEFDPFDVIIAPYSIMVAKGKPKGEPTIMHSVKWGRVVLDEGHEIRNISSKLNASIRTLKSQIKWVISGTPVYNSIKDFVALCGFIGIPQNMVQGMQLKVKETFVMRRTKQDVAEFNKRLELPPCDFKNVELEMYSEEYNLYQRVFDESREYIKELFATSQNIGMHSMFILECFLRTRQAMIYPQLYLDGIAKKNETDVEIWNHPTKKMDTLLELIQTHPTEKSLVFCQFMGEMNHIETMLNSQGIETFRIDGSVERDLRNSRIKEFRDSKNGCVFIIQIKAGGQGLNLQEATRVYITSPSWNPATEMQAIARSHRTGQTQRVVVRKLVYTGTEELPSIEETMMVLQNHKSTVCADVLNDQRLATQIPVASKNVSIRDIKKIFRV